jgi:hypothetical protein
MSALQVAFAHEGSNALMDGYMCSFAVLFSRHFLGQGLV